MDIKQASILGTFALTAALLGTTGTLAVAAEQQRMRCPGDAGCPDFPLPPNPIGPEKTATGAQEDPMPRPRILSNEIQIAEALLREFSRQLQMKPSVEENDYNVIQIKFIGQTYRSLSSMANGALREKADALFQEHRTAAILDSVAVLNTAAMDIQNYWQNQDKPTPGNHPMPLIFP